PHHGFAPRKAHVRPAPSRPAPPIPLRGQLRPFGWLATRNHSRRPFPRAGKLRSPPRLLLTRDFAWPSARPAPIPPLAELGSARRSDTAVVHLPRQRPSGSVGQVPWRWP